MTENGNSSNIDLAELAEELTQTKDLYKILNVATTASASELKKAYRKRALSLHPDRVSAEDAPHATRCFQLLGRAHKILSDPEARAVYDETGEVPDDLADDCKDSADWAQYWRLLFKPVTKQDLDNFSKTYQNSVQEREDLRVLYEKHNGSFCAIMDWLPLAEFNEEERLEKIIRDMISTGEIPKETPLFKKETSAAAKKKRGQKAKRESREAEAALDAAGTSDLFSAIQARQRDRGNAMNSCIDGLMAKYANKEKKPQKKKTSSKPKRLQKKKVGKK